MKKLTVFLFVLIGLCVQAQIVNIPDTNFKEALLTHTPVLDFNADGEIQVSEAEAFNGVLNVRLKNITDLTGIASFVNISQLICDRNDLSSLDISSNTALTVLNCNENNLTELDLTSCISLNVLYCDSNQLISLTLNSVYLSILSCYNNNLNSLYIQPNSLLSFLECSCNSITSLDVSDQPSLTDLLCISNNLSSLNVNNNLSIEYIDCSYNNLTELDLTNVPSLRTLEISNNNLSSIDISNLSHLTEFYCHNNNLSSIDVLNNPSLSIIGVNYNDLSEIDLSNCPNLWGLDCAGNNISSLNLSNTGYFFECFHCGDNDLNFLDMRNGFNENISCFSARNNPSLTCIYVDNAEYSSENWIGGIDSTSTFVENEAECEALAIDENLLIDEIFVFPNPFSNSLNLDFKIDKKFKISIYNIIGKKLITSDKKHFDTSNLPNGLYILKIEFVNGMSLTKKIIKVGA